MIISLVRSLPEAQIDCEPDRRWLSENLGFVTDEHQINVALTRAKQGLCIIGKMGKNWLISYCVSTDQQHKVKRKQSLPFPKYQQPDIFILTLCQFFLPLFIPFCNGSLSACTKSAMFPHPLGVSDSKECIVWLMLWFLRIFFMIDFKIAIST